MCSATSMQQWRRTMSMKRVERCTLRRQLCTHTRLRAQSGCPRILQTEKPARRRRRRRPPPEAEIFSGFKRFSTILPTFYSAIGPGTISVSGPRELNRACTPPSITYAGPRRRRQAGRRSEAKRPRKWQALHWLHVGKPHCQKITWAHVTHAAGHWRPFDKVHKVPGTLLYTETLRNSGAPNCLFGA